MSPLALGLVLISACIHAGWNLLSKSQQPRPAFFLVASLTGALFLSPVLFLHWGVAMALPPVIWRALALTGFCMALYYVGLAGAYRKGDLSVAYPLARSSPVIVVLVVSVLLGRGQEVSTACVIGIILVVAGCFLIPLRQCAEFHPRNYLNAGCGLALLAALGTTGYSIIDDEALRHLRSHPPGGIGPIALTLLYGCIQAASAAFWQVLIVASSARERTGLRQLMARRPGFPIAAGVAIYVAYALVLVALAHADNVSYIVGFRQISIPLGALLGIVVLKEVPYRPKLAGVAVMFFGLLLIAFG